MDFRQQHNDAGRTRAKTDGDYQTEDPHENITGRTVELFKCHNKTAITRVGYTDRLEDGHDHLEKEDEKKDHKVCARIFLERFIGGTIPAEE